VESVAEKMNDEKSLVLRLSTVSTFLIYWIPPFACGTFIFYFSSLPGTACPSPFSHADKVFHLGEYGIFAYFLARALAYHHLQKEALFLTVCSICLIYGVSDELHQYFVPERCPSFMDLAADGLGSSLGAGVYSIQRKT